MILQHDAIAMTTGSSGINIATICCPLVDFADFLLWEFLILCIIIMIRWSAHKGRDVAPLPSSQSTALLSLKYTSG
jgi:hypothetical protein